MFDSMNPVGVRQAFETANYLKTRMNVCNPRSKSYYLYFVQRRYEIQRLREFCLLDNTKRTEEPGSFREVEKVVASRQM